MRIADPRLAKFEELADKIMMAAQLAGCLEVSGYPKPGNVHRLQDFPDTSFEQFLAGSIALGPSMRTAFLRGVAAALGIIDVCDVGLGVIIEEAVKDVSESHRGGNTHLGIALLFTPLAAGMGYTAVKAEGLNFNGESLRECVKVLLENSTPNDAIHLCRAISSVGSKWLGRVDTAPDVSRIGFEDEILSRNHNLESLLMVSREWDIVAREVSECYPITFTEGLPTFRDLASRYDLNTAIVHLFLHILSRHTDTFIARKAGLRYTVNAPEAVRIGMKKASEVSEEAAKILSNGGLLTSRGATLLRKLDSKLRDEGLNPGSTADLTATVLFVALATGFKP